MVTTTTNPNKKKKDKGEISRTLKSGEKVTFTGEEQAEARQIFEKGGKASSPRVQRALDIIASTETRGRALVPEEREKERGEQFQLETDPALLRSQETLARLDEAILNNPQLLDLVPIQERETILQRIGLKGSQLGLAAGTGGVEQALVEGIQGQPLTEQQQQTAAGVQTIGGLTLAGAAATPLVTPAFTAATGVLGKIGTGIKTAVAGLALYSFGGSTFNINGGKLESARASINEISSATDPLVSTARESLDPQEAARKGITEFIKLSDDVDRYERQIAEIGATNLQFKSSKQYLEIQEEIANARRDIRDGLTELQTLAVRGL